MSEVSVNVTLTPEQLAEQFWNLNSEQQVDFFAALDNVAGLDLCQQMAFVVGRIRLRADSGDRAAQHGFQTMLAHAQAYAESATDLRVWGAKLDLRRMAEDAKA